MNSASKSSLIASDSKQYSTRLLFVTMLIFVELGVCGLYDYSHLRDADKSILHSDGQDDARDAQSTPDEQAEGDEHNVGHEDDE